MAVRHVVCALVALGALGAPAVAPAQEPPPGDPVLEQTIAKGVRAGGVDVGGLTVFNAAVKLEQTLGPRLGRNVVVWTAGRRYRMAAADAGFQLDSVTSAKRAYYAGRTDPRADVALAVSHRRASVRAFADSVTRKVSRAPRDATVRITISRMVVRGSRRGRTLDARALAAAIDRSLADPSAARTFRPRLRSVRPAVTIARLRALNGTVLTVDRSTRRLRLFKGLRWRKTYSIAVGAAGHETPTGLFRIQSRQVNPAWHVPNSAWAGSMAGKVVPGGAPNNPLKARWLGVSGSVGIHGTAEEWSIGSRASKGCIRMRVADVVDLYPRVPVGARILIR
jgi:lipoprotein-anchoring transpeptidase ErfK/SrfK